MVVSGEMDSFNFDKLNAEERYRFLADAMQPRPVCLISTRRPDGSPHWAPFSFVSAVGVNPPAVVFCPSANADGTDKTTLQNLEATGCFVANFVSKGVMAVLFDNDGLGSAEWQPASSSSGVRLSGSVVQLECDLHEVIRLGEGPFASIMVVGIVRAAHRGPGSHIGKVSGAEYVDLESGEFFTLDAP